MTLSCLFRLYWLFSLPGSLLSYLTICSYHGLKCFLPRENPQLLLLFAAQIVPAWPGGIPAGLCRSFLPVTLLRKCFFYFLILKSVLVLDSSSIPLQQAVYASHARLHNPASLYCRLALETKYGPGVAVLCWDWRCASNILPSTWILSLGILREHKIACLLISIFLGQQRNCVLDSCYGLTETQQFIG